MSRLRRLRNVDRYLGDFVGYAWLFIDAWQDWRGVRLGGAPSKRRVACSKRGWLLEPPLLGCARWERALWSLAETWQNWRSVRAGHSWTLDAFAPDEPN